MGNQTVLHVETMRHFFADMELHGSACLAGSVRKIDAIVTKRVILSDNDKGLRQAPEIAVGRTGAGIGPQFLIGCINGPLEGEKLAKQQFFCKSGIG